MTTCRHCQVPAVRWTRNRRTVEVCPTCGAVLRDQQVLEQAETEAAIGALLNQVTRQSDDATWHAVLGSLAKLYEARARQGRRRRLLVELTEPERRAVDAALRRRS